MQCAILIGGLGTRLGHLVEDCPKPLLSVNGQPFLDHILTNLARFGFDDVVLLAGYKSNVVDQFIANPNSSHNKLGLNIRIVVEAEPLGTAGALKNAESLLDPEFLLMNGDSFFDFNLLDLATLPVGEQWLGKMSLRSVEDSSRYGIVSTDSAGKVLDMKERPQSKGRQPGLINGGVYWLKREMLHHISMGFVSLERDVFPMMAQEALLFAKEYNGFFLDIGIPTDYEAAQSLLPLSRPALFLDRDGVINHDDGYTYRIDDFKWIDGAIDTIRQANRANWFVFVVTNQAGVARGFYTEEDVQKLHNWINEELSLYGAHIDDFRYCPYHPQGAVPEYRRVSNWRKPEPGMLLDILEYWPVDIQQSLLIGDKRSDIDAAKAVGIKAYKFSEGENLKTFVTSGDFELTPFLQHGN